MDYNRKNRGDVEDRLSANYSGMLESTGVELEMQKQKQLKPGYQTSIVHPCVHSTECQKLSKTEFGTKCLATFLTSESPL